MSVRGFTNKESAQVSGPDVATLPGVRRLVPRVAAQPPAALVRWLLRVVTAAIFLAATVIGVQVGLAAPTESPASSRGPGR